MHGQIETALAYQLKALALHEKGDSTFFHLQSLNAVAVTYEALGDWRRSLTYYKRALAVAEKSSSARIPDFLRANLGGLMAFSGNDYQEVPGILEGVIARGLDAYPSLRLRTLSHVYLMLGRLDDALTAIQQSLDQCGTRELECIDSLNQRAAVHAARGNEQAALEDVRAALSKVEAVRTRLVPSDFFKQHFNLAQENIYSRAIACRCGRARRAMRSRRGAGGARAFIDLLASKISG